MYSGAGSLLRRPLLFQRLPHSNPKQAYKSISRKSKGFRVDMGDSHSRNGYQHNTNNYKVFIVIVFHHNHLFKFSAVTGR